MLLLNVPYEEKDEAKALGARWRPDHKKWSVLSGRDYYKFDGSNDDEAAKEAED